MQEILSLLATDDVGNGLKTDVTDKLSMRITDQASATSATTSAAASATEEVLLVEVSQLFAIIKRNAGIDEKVGIAYANLLLSDEGQRLVEQAGYVPIRNSK